MFTKSYNRIVDRPDIRGKGVDMSKVLFAVALAVALAGCETNETTFYVKNMIAQPKAPECVSNSGDDAALNGVLDLAFRNPFFAFFLVKNTLIAQEDLQNLRAESNGVFIEGMEVYVQSTFMQGSQQVGEVEFYEFEQYIDPESEDVVPGYVISPSLVVRLADAYGCPAVYNPASYPEPWKRGSYAAGLATVSSVVRFLGHTNGGVEVETPEFSISIDLCCGCLVNWINCLSESTAKCEEPEESEMCVDGVASAGTKYDCRWLYYSPNDPICISSE